MNTKPSLADAHNSGSSEPFHVRCEAGDDNHFRVTTESLTVTVGQRVLREGALEMWDSVSIYAKEDREGNLVVEVLVFNPDWDEPLRIAAIRSRPHDATCLTAVGLLPGSRHQITEMALPARQERRATMRYPEVKGKVVDFIRAAAQTEGAFVNIRFTDKTDLGLTFNAKMKLTHASLNDASDGNFELVKEYEVPS
jgi:hypothetical protein